MLETNVTRPQVMGKLSLALLSGLLILRLPVLVIAYYVPTAAKLVPQIYFPLTYAMTAALMFIERKRLSAFNIGSGSLLLYTLAPLLELHGRHLLGRTAGYTAGFTNWAILAISLALLVAVVIRGAEWPRVRRQAVAWSLAAVPIGLLSAFLFGMALRLQVTNYTHVSLTASAALAACILMSLVQMGNAAVAEEPLFRGFLWGYLRLRGWRDWHILLLQAGLFWAGHIYYFPRSFISFWVVVPLSGILLGFLTWQSKSIVPSMIVHAMTNGIAQLVYLRMLP